MFSAAQNLTLTVIRVSLGLIALMHGLANSFGLFGGPGIERFATDMEARLAIAPGLTSFVVAFGELFIGLALISGAFARIAASVALILVVAMTFVTARYTTFFVQNAGFEYLLALAALCLVVTMFGAGAFCLDVGKLLQKMKERRLAKRAGNAEK
jgi:putative oxidoreductase